VISSKSRASHDAASNRDRNADPNDASPAHGMSGWTTTVLPGVRRSSAPAWTTTNLSVVGSGPMCAPQ
jgi:hypothetical protein